MFVYIVNVNQRPCTVFSSAIKAAKYAIDLQKTNKYSDILVTKILVDEINCRFV